MDINDLEKFRRLVPGVIINLFILPIIITQLNIESLKTKINDYSNLLSIISFSAIFIALCYVLGYVYSVLPLRKFITREPLEKINLNIKEKLIKPFENDPKVAEGYAQLINDKRLMNIFYQIIDNDESLKQKTKRVYINGLLLSSTADIIISSAIFGFLYIVINLFTDNSIYIWFAFVSFLLFFIAKLLMKIVIKKHMELGDDQIDFIHTNHKKKLEKMIIDIQTNR